MNRVEPSLDTVAPLHPNHPYDMKEIIHKVVDDGIFFEIQPNFAKNIIIGINYLYCLIFSLAGLGRMEGRTVGFVANQPLELAGVLDIDASCKAAR
jgi:propionyl-CoA carboxylase beta chain